MSGKPLKYHLVAELRPPDAVRRLDEWKAANAAAISAVPEEAVIFDIGRDSPSGTFVRVRVASEYVGVFRDALKDSRYHDAARNEALVLVLVGDVRRKSLVGIVAFADAANRDYLPDPVFRAAVDRLAARGLVSVDDVGIAATPTGRSLLKETESTSGLDQADEIARRLPEIPLNEFQPGLVAEGAYAAAISQYHEQFRKGQRTFR
jgi:hypothetical protein